MIIVSFIMISNKIYYVYILISFKPFKIASLV